MSFSRIIENLKTPHLLLSKMYLKMYRLLRGMDPAFKKLERNGVISFNEESRTYVRSIEGLQFNLNPNDGGISKALAKDGIREKESVEALKRFMTPDMKVLDLGSNIGFYLLLEAKIIRDANGSGRVVGCEPFPQSVELSRLNVRANDFDSIVAVHHAAISNESGTVRMAKSSYSNCHQLLALSVREDSEYYEVPGYSLEEFLDFVSMPLSELDFLRMDVEGAEYLILPPALDLICQKERFLMFIEFHPHVNPDGHARLLKSLEGSGFVCLDATKETFERNVGRVVRKHRPNATIEDLYNDSFYTQHGGCEVFLGKNII